MLKRVGILILGILCLSISGCIKDSQDDCPVVYRYDLTFLYYGNGSTDIFDSKIGSVDMYLFDESGQYLDVYKLSKADLSAFQGAQLTVEPGNYHVVCWGNISSLSEITTGSGNREDYSLYSASYLHNEPVTDFDSLYYGTKVISIPERTDRADTVLFRSSHINMEIYVEGLETSVVSRAVNDPEGWLELHNVYTGYDFDMKVIGETSIIYPDFIRDESGKFLFAGFNLFRFMNDNGIVINLYNGDRDLVYSFRLADFLKDHNIVVEGINEITVPIYIKISGPYVHVSVAEWDSTEVRPVF